MRRAAKRDTSEKPITDALTACGFSWARISAPDLPDLIIAKGRRFMAWAECKTGKAKLKPGQAAFAQRWPQEVFVLRSPECVLKLAKKEVARDQ